jgi:cytochrome oxidase Cu insertion factor (SCO1/SenC/PrrC family)
MRRALAAGALIAALLLGCCSSALADGDPASDFLLKQQVFVLLQGGGAPPAQKQLTEVVAKANKAGFAIRVAVISSEYDLGSVGVLWKNPQKYAEFLGIELSLAYKGLLLVAMPDGFGLNWPGHSTAAAGKALAGIKVPPGELGTITAATAAVHALAGVAGVHSASSSKAASAASKAGVTQAAVASSAGHSGARGIGFATILIIGAAALLLIALGAGMLERRRKQRPRAAAGIPLKWALPRVAALFAVAVAVPIVAVGLLRRSSPNRASQTTAQSEDREGAHQVTQETPFTWNEGQRAAPGFTLTDQSGGSISPGRYRGRPLIITFIDPLCRNLCPLEAKVLNEVDERLPADERPTIIAVSVDVYADTHADLMLDFRRWGLVPQWEWAVGSPAQLEAVWKRYYAEVEVQTKHIAGTTVHYITHSEMAYVVDGKGYERALFSWPFTAKAVKTTLMHIES